MTTLELKLLGTGPSGGIAASGRSGRTESSALLNFADHFLLIDVTTYFEIQSRHLVRTPDAVCITHGHRDAIGGIGKLNAWAQRLGSGKIPVYTQAKTIERIHKLFKNFSTLEFLPLDSFESFVPLPCLSALTLPVRHAADESVFPTFGYKFCFPSGKSLAYISDTSGWSDAVHREIEGVDILVLDGAMWGRGMFAHLDMKRVAPQAKNWGVGRLIFTQIGRSAPPHGQRRRELAKLWPRAEPGYDGMTVRL